MGCHRVRPDRRAPTKAWPEQPDMKVIPFGESDNGGDGAGQADLATPFRGVNFGLCGLFAATTGPRAALFPSLRQSWAEREYCFKYLNNMSFLSQPGTGAQSTLSILGAPVASMTRRSKPSAMPDAGGI